MEVRKVPSAFERVFGKSLLPTVEYDGYQWVVGNVSKRSEYPITIDDLVRFYPLVVKAFMSDKKEIAVSVPAENFYENLSLVRLIESEIKDRTGVKAQVYPQGVVAIHSLNLPKDRKTLIIDGGFSTLNIAIVENGNAAIYVKTYYNEFGIRDLLEIFRTELKKKYPEITNNLQRLKDIYLTEEIDSGFRIFNVSAEKEITLQTFLEILFSRITKDLERAEVGFQQFAIIGGLSYYISQDMIETDKKYEIGDEFSTVKGMVKVSGLPSIDLGFGDIKMAGV